MHPHSANGILIPSFFDFENEIAQNSRIVSLLL